jgi:DNA invertase Pin-like site-specific DNA recombinase
MAVYAYLRTSLVAGDEGDPPEVQLRAISQYARRHEMVLAQCFEDVGTTGSTFWSDRPQATLMMDMLEDGDAIVAAKVDRVFKSSVDLLCAIPTLQRRKVGLHLVDLDVDLTRQPVYDFVSAIVRAINGENAQTRQRHSVSVQG